MPCKKAHDICWIAFREKRHIAFSYNKLWKLFIDKKMMKKDLIAQANITSTTMAKLGKDLP